MKSATRERIEEKKTIGGDQRHTTSTKKIEHKIRFQAIEMGGCIGINRNEGDTVNGSSLNVTRPQSGK